MALAVLVLVYPSDAVAIGSCPAGQFPDGQTCYSCGDGIRTAEPVTSQNSCTVWEAPRSSATRTGAAQLGFICPLGQLPYKGGCYACPSNYIPNPFVAATHPSACSRPGKFRNYAAVKKEVYCGKEGMVPCAIWQRLPSCDQDGDYPLYESKGKCEKVPPGKSPFLATLDEWTKETVKGGTDWCNNMILNLPAPPEPFPLVSQSYNNRFKNGLTLKSALQYSGDYAQRKANKDVQDSAICAKNYTAGFVCSIPGMLSSVGNLAEVMDRFGHAFDREPCSIYRDANAPTYQLACAVSEGLGIQSAVKLAQCAADAMKNAAPQSQQEELAQECKTAGSLSFKVAEYFAGKKMAEAISAKVPSERIKQIAETLEPVYKAVGYVLSVEAIKDAMAKTGSCAIFNDPDPAPIGANTELPKATPAEPIPASTLPPPTAVTYRPLVSSQNSIVQFRNVANPRCMIQRSTDHTQFYVTDCDRGSEQQTWVVVRRAGFFTIRSRQSWQCLTHGAPRPGGTTVQMPCDIKKADQRWSIRPVPGTDGFSISPFSNRGMCLATENGNNNARVPYQACNASKPQQWHMASFGSLKRVKLKYAQEGRCMTQSGSFDNGQQVSQINCNNASFESNTIWMIESAGKSDPDLVYLRNETSGMCLDLNGASTARQTKVQQWRCSKNAPGQIFELAGVGRGSYPLQLRAYQDYKQCVTLQGDGKGDNKKLWVWPCSKGGAYDQYGKNDKVGLEFQDRPTPVWVEWTDTNAYGIDVGIGGSEPVVKPDGTKEGGWAAWVIGSDSQVYRWNGSGFDLMGGGSATRIDVGPDGNAVVIGDQNTIWGWDPGLNDFVQIPGNAIDITISAMNVMYMIDANDKQIYEWNNGTKQWQPSAPFAGKGGYRDLEAGPYGEVFALGQTGALYTLQKNGRVDIGGLAEPVSNDIGTSPDGTIWATGTDGSVSQYINGRQRGWQLKANTGGNRFVRIEGSVRGWVWAIRDDGKIFYGEAL